jgi:hypothetical protein
MYCENISRLEKKKLTAIPAKSIEFDELERIDAENIITRRNDATAPQSAPNAVKGSPENVPAAPVKITIAAPHDAPLATPRVNGSAIGFLNMP